MGDPETGDVVVAMRSSLLKQRCKLVDGFPGCRVRADRCSSGGWGWTGKWLSQGAGFRNWTQADGLAGWLCRSWSSVLEGWWVVGLSEWPTIILNTCEDNNRKTAAAARSERHEGTGNCRNVTGRSYCQRFSSLHCYTVEELYKSACNHVT